VLKKRKNSIVLDEERFYRAPLQLATILGTGSSLTFLVKQKRRFAAVIPLSRYLKPAVLICMQLTKLN
jgi:hypothetical protein